MARNALLSFFALLYTVRELTPVEMRYQLNLSLSGRSWAPD
jgi:hypothetical protein